MKDKRIIRLKLAAERDQRLTGDTFRVLCRIGSMLYVDPKATLEKAFPLPWSKVAVWCGLSDDKAASRRIWELVAAGYLKCDGVRGCPPINHFYLNPNCPSKGAIDCPAGGAIKRPSRGVINSGAGGALHISNSFQEEKIKRKTGEFNGSLRSKVTSEGNKSSLRSKETKVESMAASPRVFVSAAKRKELFKAALAASGLSQMTAGSRTVEPHPAATLAGGSKSKPKAKASLEGKND